MVAFRHFTSPPVDDNCTLESPEATDTTLEVAENDASDVADMFVSLSDWFSDASSCETIYKDEPGRLYKNLLQELAQREGFSMPVYTTVKSGVSLMPTFSSTVDVKGENFCGHVEMGNTSSCLESVISSTERVPFLARIYA